MLPDPPEIAQLLKQARQGDREAVDKLLGQYREALRRRISLRLDPALAARLDASDVVQDVLLEASRRLQDYLKNPGMPFGAWLQHISRDHLIDAWRRHRQAQRRSLDREQSVHAGFADRSSVELAAQLVDQELTPASAAMRHELECRLGEAMTSLSQEDQEVLWMRHYEHLSNQAMAAELGLREEAASMRYIRALRRLKAKLDDNSQE